LRPMKSHSFLFRCVPVGQSFGGDGHRRVQDQSHVELSGS
jgi:hypothetical protein